MQGSWTGAERASTATRWQQKRDPENGPNPTDRGKPGTKLHLVVDQRGTPLGVCLSPTNRHDSLMLAPTFDTMPGMRHAWAQPR